MAHKEDLSMDPILEQSEIHLSRQELSTNVEKSDSYYIKTHLELDMAKSLPSCPEANSYIETRYGIKEFDKVVERYFPLAGEQHTALLPRQIMMPCTETIATVLLCEILDLSPILGTFTTDTFSHGSVDKSAAVKTKSTTWRQTSSGKIICDYSTTRLTTESLESLSGTVIDALRTSSGDSLVDYHLSSLRKVFGRDLVTDCSGFFYEILKEARVKPEYCYVRNDLNKSVKICTKDIDLDKIGEHNVRPPASWYYPILFSLFVDKLFLLETYENSRGEVSEARELFRTTSDEILAATGRRPRVIEILPLSKEMLLLNNDIINEGSSAMAKMSLECCKFRSSSVLTEESTHLELAKQVTRIVLEYGKQRFLPANS